MAIALVPIVATAGSSPAPSNVPVAHGAASHQSWRPTYKDTPYPDVAASSDPAVIAEGEYLFHAVGQCTSCHLPHEKVAFVSGAEMRRLLPSGGQEWARLV
jgi:mono/diheme cytochrome c family protein